MFNLEVFALGVARDPERFFRAENNFQIKKDMVKAHRSY